MSRRAAENLVPTASDAAWLGGLTPVADFATDGMAVVVPASQQVLQANAAFARWQSAWSRQTATAFWDAVGASALTVDGSPQRLAVRGERVPLWASAVRPGQVFVLVAVGPSHDVQPSSHHDALTGLADRKTLDLWVEQLWPAGRPPQRPLAVLFVDFDDFKQVNDTLGHIAGDGVLRTLSQRLQATLRASDRLVRYGGDEFVVLVDGLRQFADLERLIQRLQHVADTPVEVEGQRLQVGVSVGAAHSSEGFAAFWDMLAAADQRMYAHKRRGV